MTAVAAPRLPGHLPSTGDVGVKYGIKYQKMIFDLVGSSKKSRVGKIQCSSILPIRVANDESQSGIWFILPAHGASPVIKGLCCTMLQEPFLSSSQKTKDLLICYTTFSPLELTSILVHMHSAVCKAYLGGEVLL